MNADDTPEGPHGQAALHNFLNACENRDCRESGTSVCLEKREANDALHARCRDGLVLVGVRAPLEHGSLHHRILNLLGVFCRQIDVRCAGRQIPLVASSVVYRYRAYHREGKDLGHDVGDDDDVHGPHNRACRPHNPSRHDHNDICHPRRRIQRSHLQTGLHREVGTVYLCGRNHCPRARGLLHRTHRDQYTSEGLHTYYTQNFHRGVVQQNRVYGEARARTAAVVDHRRVVPTSLPRVHLSKKL